METEGISYNPLVTPFLNGKLDLDSLNRVGDRSAENENRIFGLGATSEYPFLSVGDRMLIGRHLINRYGSSNVIVGTSADTIEDTIRLTNDIADASCRTIVLTLNYKTNGMSPIEHFQRVVDGTGLGALVYINSSLSGSDPSYEQIKALSELDFVRGTKITTGGMEIFSRVTHNLGSYGFSVFQGSQDKIKQSLALPIAGIVFSMGNTFPDLTARLVQETRTDEDIAEAIRRHEEIKSTTKKPGDLGYMPLREYTLAIKRILFQQGMIKSPEPVSYN